MDFKLQQLAISANWGRKELYTSKESPIIHCLKEVLNLEGHVLLTKKGTIFTKVCLGPSVINIHPVLKLLSMSNRAFFWGISLFSKLISIEMTSSNILNSKSLVLHRTYATSEGIKYSNQEYTRVGYPILGYFRVQVPVNLWKTSLSSFKLARKFSSKLGT